MAESNQQEEIPLEEPEEEYAEVEDVLDEAESNDSIAIERYDITNYGADFDVDGLVKRINRSDIYIPSFQRDYVWKLPEASRFIESLLLGLPVPGIFLAKDPDTNKLLVIDGQQRLKTLQYFYKGYFNPKDGDKNQRVFKLDRVQPQFDGKTYETLEEKDRIKLDDSIIHATIIKQEQPADEDTSVYHVFERLNTGGRRLQPQEIRKAIYHGKLNDSIKELNNHRNWRDLYGKKSNRLKDEELILRFFALYADQKGYTEPMYDFLNRYNKVNQKLSDDKLKALGTLFTNTIDLAFKGIGLKVFKPERSFNAAIFDSISVGLAKRLEKGPVIDMKSLAQIYLALIKEKEFLASTQYSTSSKQNVNARIDLAVKRFAMAK